MGLDINFYSVRTAEVGYFRKVNFILTYFNITTLDQDGQDFKISKEEFANFVADMKCELAVHKNLNTKLNSDEQVKPDNPAFYCSEVFFGGSTLYDYNYWDDFKAVYNWANTLLNTFDWDQCDLVINADW